MNNQELWQAVLGELELNLSKPNFTTWFKNTFIINYQDRIVVIGVPNAFTKAWLEKKYHNFILKALKNITNGEVNEISYKIETLKEKELEKTSQTSQNIVLTNQPTIEKTQKNNQVSQTSAAFTLLPKYTFETFIIGKNNELAAAAALAVAQNPGEIYNPLFIYGGVGLGKTHLLQAIGNEIISKDPQKKILYVSCEKFTNDFINAISQGKMDSFKNKYRNTDLLLVDDIQFLSGKEGTQEEFFHTFNALHQSNKQIIVSSDRPPKAIADLEQRLLSRFEWGMIADVNSPNLETRIAILESKCREKGINLSSDVINYVANVIQNNIRELEGALNRIIAYQQLNNLEPTLENVKITLAGIVSTPQKKNLTPKQIISAVSQYFDIKIEDVLGSCRKKHLAVPRQIAMYLIRTELNNSFPSIGSEVGNRDHTTVMHAVDKITKEVVADNTKTIRDLNLIKEKLYS